VLPVALVPTRLQFDLVVGHCTSPRSDWKTDSGPWTIARTYGSPAPSGALRAGHRLSLPSHFWRIVVWALVALLLVRVDPALAQALIDLLRATYGGG
jgi:hypothetical protein